MRDRSIYRLLGTGFYTGYAPIAPGTAGSLVGVVLFALFFHRLSLPLFLITLCGLFAIGILSAAHIDRAEHSSDNSMIVIDEVVGMLLTYTALPATPWILFLGFLLFRLFDIFKPWPACLIQRRMHTPLGVMLDDLVAGAYAWLVLVLGGQVWSLF